MKKTDVERMNAHKETKSPLTSKKAFIPLAVTVLSILLAAVTEMGVPPSPGGTNSGAQCQEYWRMSAGELQRSSHGKDPLLVQPVAPALLDVDHLAAGDPLDLLTKLANVRPHDGRQADFERVQVRQ